MVGGFVGYAVPLVVRVVVGSGFIVVVMVAAVVVMVVVTGRGGVDGVGRGVAVVRIDRFTAGK